MTVAVLAAGLFVAGVGTSFVLYSALLTNVDETVRQLAQTDDVAKRLLDVSETDEGTIEVRPIDDDLRANYFVALYGPEGELVGSAGGIGDDAEGPDFPTTLTPDQAQTLTSRVFGMESASGSAFRASVAIVEPQDTNTLYSQVVAMPHAEALGVVRTYFAVFTFVSLMTIVAGAFLIRWLVTLTFRRFGQVESTAMAIANGDYRQRMAETEPRTEIGRLTSAINTMLDRVDHSLAQRDATVRQMRRFIGDASHELRTPLVSVRGYAELYRMGAIKTPEDTAKAMERIEKEATRMGALVEDLLALARLDERRELEIAPIDLRKVARDLALDARAADPDRRVSVVDHTLDALTGPIGLVRGSSGGVLPRGEESGEEEVQDDATDSSSKRGRRKRGAAPSALERATTSAIDILRRRRPADDERASQNESGPTPTLDFTEPRTKFVAVPPIVLGEENKVRQVITNLLGNARRYSPEGSPIELEVGVDAEADMGWIAVTDHGEGVPEAIREQIFQRFWRADTSRARETGGSGLGLAIVSSIVEAHHGSVSVEDTPGGGARFRVAFPLVERRDIAEHAQIETQPLPRLRDLDPDE